MRVRVRFRFNTRTGEVEMFQVDDVGGAAAGRDHDAEHDRISAEVGAIAARRPDVEEVEESPAPGADPGAVVWSTPRPTGGQTHAGTEDESAADRETL